MGHHIHCISAYVNTTVQPTRVAVCGKERASESGEGMRCQKTKVKSWRAVLILWQAATDELPEGKLRFPLIKSSKYGCKCRERAIVLLYKTASVDTESPFWGCSEVSVRFLQEKKTHSGIYLHGRTIRNICNSWLRKIASLLLSWITVLKKILDQVQF